MEFDGIKAVLAAVTFFVVLLVGGNYLNQTLEARLGNELLALILSYILVGALSGLVSYAVFSFPDFSSIFIGAGALLGLIVATAIWIAPIIRDSLRSIDPQSQPIAIALWCCAIPTAGFIVLLGLRRMLGR